MTNTFWEITKYVCSVAHTEICLLFERYFEILMLANALQFVVWGTKKTVLTEDWKASSTFRKDFCRAALYLRKQSAKRA